MSQVFRGSPDAYKISLKRVQLGDGGGSESGGAVAGFRMACTFSKWIRSRITRRHPQARIGAKRPRPGAPPELKLPKLQQPRCRMD